MEPQLVADYACQCAENPLWHPTEKRLYWTDIPTGLMFRYSPDRDEHEQFYEGDIVGGFTFQADGAMLLFMARGAIRIWNHGRLATVLDGIPGEEESRFNDVIADPEGRVFAGTMSTEQHKGNLYRIDPDGTYHLVIPDVGCSNGMGFNLDRTQFYHTDSAARKIMIYDYDRATGEISSPSFFTEVAVEEGVPDGMTVDAEGCIWSARWGGGCIVRYARDGQELSRMEFPAKRVSSVTFGGDDYRTLYVTTAGGEDKEANGSGAGAVYRVPMEVAGLPEFASRVMLV